MSEFVNYLLFGWYPYIAVTVMILGSIIRFDREQYTWRSQSSQFLRRRQMVWGSNLFHAGILVLFVGHFVGLLTPVAVFDTLGISHSFKQVLAIAVGDIAAVCALVGGTMLVHRRLYDPRIRSTSSRADILVLVLLWLQLVLGMGTTIFSIRALGGEEMVRFMNWANALYTFDPNAWVHVAGANLVFKTHIVLGLTLFLITPFTRLVHVWSVPIWYLGRRGYQVVRAPGGVRGVLPPGVARTFQPSASSFARQRTGVEEAE